MRFAVLGAVAVTDAEGADRTPAGDRQRLLLATLLAAGGRSVSSDRLIEELWGDDLPANPEAALQSQVSRLRRALRDDRPERLVTDAEGYRLVLHPDDELDAARFERLLAESTAADGAGSRERGAPELEAALGLWHGDAYGELADRPGVQPEAVRLDELRVTTVEHRAAALLADGRRDDALAAAEELVRSWPLRERPQALLMEALYAAGRQAEALDAYRRYRALLGEELGLEPSPALAELEGRILRHEVELPPAATSRRPSRPAPPGPPATSFVGREGDLAGVVQRLSACRLVTVCGTGGVGKTRLALEVAARLGARYPDGVVVLELAQLAPGDDVAVALASALGVPERVGTAVLDRVVEAVGAQSLLLVLDNCEHVLDAAAAAVDTLLRRAAGVDVLATSRAALAVDGEQVWPLVPLGAGGTHAPAVRLFADRARAARPDVPLDGSAQPLVERICSHLDGLPLALELAAARLRVTGLADVLEAVDGHRELLGGGRRVVDQRHRSLEALVDWSYDLLGADEQRLFARLSVFAGPFGADEAAAVAADDDLTAGRVPGLLWALVEQSMVSVADGGDGASGTRYVLLETLRHAGRERLRQEGCLERFQQRHAEHVLAVAEAARLVAQGPGAPDALRTVERLVPEVRAAVAHLVASGDVDGQAHLAAALFWFSFSRLHSEVGGWVLDAAEAVAGRDVELEPALLGQAATVLWQRGDLDAGLHLAQRGIETAHRLGDPPGSHMPYQAASEIALFQGDVTTAIRLAAGARERAADVLPLDAVNTAVNAATVLAYGGHGAEAVPLADAALRDAEASGSPIGIAWAAYTAGEVRLETDPEPALVLLDRAVAVASEVDERMVAGVARLSAVSLRGRLGRGGEDDVRGYRELVEHWRHAGAWTQQWTTLRNLVDLLARRPGEERYAARLLGATSGDLVSAASYGAEAARLERAAEALRWRLGADYEAERAAGAALRPEEVVDLALAVLDRAARADGRSVRTILFTDLVGSTGELERRGDAAWRRLLDRHDEVVRATVGAEGGAVVKTTGDGVMAAFEAPGAAVRAAVGVVAAVRPLGLDVRAGLHTGECDQRGDDLSGQAVHVAARVAARAGAGEVLVTRTVRDLLAGGGHSFVPHGRVELRGLSETWDLYALADPGL